MVIFGILVGLLLLSIMMLVHELGHFLAGKALGFKIISFNLFMGPILWQKKGADGVVYTLRLIPMGASVEFAGEDSGINELPEDVQDETQELVEKVDPDDPGFFFNRPRWARAIVIAMGPIFNFLTALLAFVIMFVSFGVQLPVIADVQPNSRADKAGIEAGDRIVRLNNYGILSTLDFILATNMIKSEVDDFVLIDKNGQRKELLIDKEYEESYRLGFTLNPNTEKMVVYAVDPQSNEGNPVLEKGDEILAINGISAADSNAFQKEVETNGGKQVELTINRSGKEQTINMTISSFKDEVPLGIMGLRYAENLGETLHQAVVYPISVIKSTFKGLSMIFSGELKAQDGLAGPVAIVGMVGDVVKEEGTEILDKVEQLLALFGLISVAVGFTNLLPIPPFDGFQLLTLAIESTIRRDIPMKVKEGLALVGFIIIILLVIFVFYLDISRLFT